MDKDTEALAAKPPKKKRATKTAKKEINHVTLEAQREALQVSNTMARGTGAVTDRTTMLTNMEADECLKCGLYKNCQTPFMAVSGAGGKRALIVSEYPTRQEDLKGEHLIGDSGQMLNNILRVNGLDLKKDFWKTGAVNCNVPGGKGATVRQIRLCRAHLQDVIKRFQPQFIWLLGKTAVEAMYSGRMNNVGITKLRGGCIPDIDYNAWVFPIYHPSYVVRNEFDTGLKSLYSRDIKKAIKKMEALGDSRPTALDIETPMNMLTDCDEVCEVLEHLIATKPVTAFDYETSSIKPYNGDHMIYTMSISTAETSWSFPIHYPKIQGELPMGADDLFWEPEQYQRVVNLVADYLEDPTLKKVNHNSKFEDVWSRHTFDVEPQGVFWCTMINQHLIDDRSGVCGLKYQAFVRWGLIGYEEEMKKYMEADGGNDYNKLYEAPLDKLLKYGAIDSYLTMRLFLEQRLVFKARPELDKCRRLFAQGIKALADTQMEGVCVDQGHYDKEDARLTREIAHLQDSIGKLPDVIAFEAKTGQPLNMKSTKQMREFMFEHLGLSSVKQTDSGADSVDASVLNELDSPFTNAVVSLRKKEKLQGTYLSQFRREVSLGKLHPSFDLHTASTGRSSSSEPNFQNIPVRDEEAKACIRKGIVPRPGNRILEIDYGSLEVRIIACYTRDRNLVAYIHDTTTDMHRDTAMGMLLMDQSQVSKALRSIAKTYFVFPEFYGSYFGSCANNIWEFLDEKLADGTPLREHLASKGIKTLPQYTEFLKSYEKVFWDRFPEVRAWQEEQYAYYRAHGRTRTFFGFSQDNYLSSNNLVNSPIQGTAFQCLLWAFIRINELRKKEQWRSKLIGQIHDSIVSDVCPDEFDHVLKSSIKIMTTDLMAAHPWLIVPMEVEPEATEVDQTWYTKKPVEIPT